MVNGEYQCYNAVATISRRQRISVDAGLRVGVTLELIACTLAHRVTDGVLYRVVHYQLQGVEGALTIHNSRVIAVGTGGVECTLLSAPLMNPRIRQVVRADGNNRIYLRMNGEEQLCNRVASFRRLSIMAIRTGRSERLTVERVVLAFVDIHRDTYINGLIDGQYQGNNTIASEVRFQRIRIGTTFGIAYVVE